VVVTIGYNPMIVGSKLHLFYVIEHAGY